MSIFDFLFRGYRKNKANETTLPKSSYKDGKYTVTSHAVKRMNERKISKGEVHTNLHTKPIKKSTVKYDKFGRPSYERTGRNKVVTEINPTNKKVTTVHRLHTKTYNKIKNKRNQYNGKHK